MRNQLMNGVASPGKGGGLIQNGMDSRSFVNEPIQTERLHLRPFAEGDAEAAFGWFGDAEVMRLNVHGPDRSIEETRRRIERYREHQAAHGFSKWVVTRRESSAAIGDCGLMLLEELHSVELGFRLARRYWGQGLATEAALGWLRVAFGALGLPRVMAFTHPENLASAAVLRKLGFSRTATGQVMGMDALIFACDESQFIRRTTKNS